MISSRTHLLESYLCYPSDISSSSYDSTTGSMEETSQADEHMRFLGDGEALCVPDCGLPFSRSSNSLLPSNTSQIEHNRALHLKNRLLWEENKRLHEEIKRLKAEAGRESDTGQSMTEDELLRKDHPVLQELLDKFSQRQDSVADAVSMLGQANKDMILTFGPHGIRHVAVQHLLWTFRLEKKEDSSDGPPIRLRFNQPGAAPHLYSRATEWIGDIRIFDPNFQRQAQALVDEHLRAEKPVEKLSEYNFAILQQIMMRYPEVKDKCPMASDIVEKQSRVISQLTTSIL